MVGFTNYQEDYESGESSRLLTVEGVESEQPGLFSRYRLAAIAALGLMTAFVVVASSRNLLSSESTGAHQTQLYSGLPHSSAAAKSPLNELLSRKGLFSSESSTAKQNQLSGSILHSTSIAASALKILKQNNFEGDIRAHAMNSIKTTDDRNTLHLKSNIVNNIADLLLNPVKQPLKKTGFPRANTLGHHASGPMTESYFSPQYGNSQGNYFEKKCPEGSYAYNIYGRGGSWIDSVGIKCALIGDIGQVGGWGGGPIYFLPCFTGINKVKVIYAGLRVGSVAPYCGRTLTNRIGSGDIGTSTTTTTFACGANKLITGVSGTANNYVNSLQFICSDVPPNIEPSKVPALALPKDVVYAVDASSKWFGAGTGNGFPIGEQWGEGYRSQNKPIYYDYSGPYGPSIQFNSAAQNAIIAPSLPMYIDSNGGFTAVSFVAFSGEPRNWERIFDFGNGMDNQNLIFARIGRTMDFIVHLRTGGSVVCETIARGSIFQGEWALWSFRYTKSSYLCQLFKNGQIIATSGANGVVSNKAGFSYPYIGRSNWWWDDYSNMNLAALYIYDRPLNDDELSAINSYASNLKPSDTKLSITSSNPLKLVPWVPNSEFEAVGGPQSLATGGGSAGYMPYYSLERNKRQYFKSKSPLTLSILDGFTIMAHAQFLGNPGNWERIFDFGNGPAAENILLARLGRSNTLVLHFYNSNGAYVCNIEAPDAIIQGQWAVFTAQFVKSTGVCTIFKNGGVLASGQSSGEAVAPGTLRNVYVGKSNWDDDLFNGKIGGILVFDSVLAPDQLSAASSDLTTRQWILPVRDVITAGLLQEISPTKSSNFIPFNNAEAYPSGGGVDGLSPYYSFNRERKQHLNTDRQLTFSMSSGLTILVYFQFTGSIGWWERIFDFGNGPNTKNVVIARVENRDQAILYIEHDGGACICDRWGSLVQDEWAVYALHFSASAKECRLYKNGVELCWAGSSGYPASRTLRNNYIGRSNWEQNGDAPTNGNFGGMLIYDRSLSPQEISAMTNYLTSQGAPLPTAAPTPVPTAVPSLSPSAVPTAFPLAIPTNSPVSNPTQLPISSPTQYPSAEPTLYPISSPTESPIANPSEAPISTPSAVPIADPTSIPVSEPTATPISEPTALPIAIPTTEPIAEPTLNPIAQPSSYPISTPTYEPIADSTPFPNADPTPNPTSSPISEPTANPIANPTESPIADPTAEPIATPTEIPISEPTVYPSADPTLAPVPDVTAEPSVSPSEFPVSEPTVYPSPYPTEYPIALPTEAPIASPTQFPIAEPTLLPTLEPSAFPIAEPTEVPIANPTEAPVAPLTVEPTVHQEVLLCQVKVEAGVELPKPSAGCVVYSYHSHSTGDERPGTALIACAAKSVGKYKINEDMLKEYGLIRSGKSTMSEVILGEKSITSIYMSSFFSGPTTFFTTAKAVSLTGVKFDDGTLANDNVKSVELISSTEKLSMQKCP